MSIGKSPGNRIRRFISHLIKNWVPIRFKNLWRLTQYNLTLFNSIRANNPQHNLWAALNSFRKGRKWILFFPDVPRKNYVMYQICQELGLRISNDPAHNFDLAVKWKDSTIYQPGPVLYRLAPRGRIVNLNCNDISKPHVDEIFKDAFGYSPVVDPLTYSGECVKKSISNAMHDGQIIQCPIPELEAGYIYQIIIDNQVDDQYVMDVRVAVFDNLIPCALIWLKPVESRFTVDIVERQLVDPSTLFSKEEQLKIIEFARKMGLDYGELDILRNRADGRIYIIDVNNTPDGPPPHAKGAKESIQVRAAAFTQAFLNRH